MTIDAPMDWSRFPHADARLRELWDEGLSASAIAARLTEELQLTVTKNMVIGRRKRLNAPVRPSPIIRRPEAEPAQAPADPDRPRAEVVRQERRQGRTAAVVASLPPPLDEPAAQPPPETPAPIRPGPTCCFPLWGNERPALAEMRFCTEPRILDEEGVPRSPYCVEHHTRCYLNVRGVGLPQGALRSGLLFGRAQAQA